MYLIDYGISRVLTNKESYVETIAKGTIHYMAPECFEASSDADTDNGGIVSKITTKVIE